ncbi:allophanate hydrolase [uncultured Williamsia sp.]|uniref:allophanate hydrolase n=1 Tax=uncultured Williamsia sp. TaxID=259311 RepID=UPI002636D982|nr:allophanate hydrolase [uncultured Williamsia sp.]
MRIRNQQVSGPTLGPSCAEIVADHRSGTVSPTVTAARVADAIAEAGDDGTWLYTVPADDLIAAAAALEQRADRDTLPLYGVPFGVKDSIDVAGVPTTLSCPDYAYTASTTAPAVQRLLDAGALFVGKTNLDQFATGLNGTRTPYTVPRSVYGDDLISGGSSSGSARAVALGQVPFAVATDTAGSGRVPAALNGVIGLKPSRGLISTVGLVPACRSLDCITVMARSVDDADRAFDVMTGRDDRDPWSRDPGAHFDGHPIRVGLPPDGDLSFFSDDAVAAVHAAVRDRIRATDDTTPMSLAPFLAAGELLYQGPWVAERLVVFGDFLADHPDSIHPVVRDILRSGAKYTAVDAFAALARLQELRAEVGRLFADVDILVVPTIGTTFTVDEVLAQPIECNTVLGHYTHFGNLLDLMGVAIPAGETADGRPTGITVLAPAGRDDLALHWAARFLGQTRDHVDSRTAAMVAG